MREADHWENRRLDMKRLETPELIYRRGKPVAVILDIDAYQELLERLEEMEDLRLLEEMRKQPIETISLEEYLQ
jgi:PHD/YefM family antitoxin component YafN of YafNO toxin-antitoxin module